MRTLLVVLAALSALAGCFPEFEDRPYLVEEARILAIRSVPAELRPNQQTSLEALVVTPAGTVQSAEIAWEFCMSARRAEERTSVTAACLDGRDLQAVESNATVLADACARFGPVPPPTTGDEPPLRASDPDPSGGYFLPVRATVTPEGGAPTSAFGFVRIRCDLAGATREVFEAFQDSYTENVNPELGPLRLNDKAASDITAAPGTTVSLSLEAPVASSEFFVVYVANDGVLYDREETLRATWYVSAGSLSQASQLLRAEDLRAGQRFTSTLTLPTGGQDSVSGWVVVRDDRGGSAWSAFTIAIGTN